MTTNMLQKLLKKKTYKPPKLIINVYVGDERIRQRWQEFAIKYRISISSLVREAVEFYISEIEREENAKRS